MRALRLYAPKDLRLDNVDEPGIESDEVLIRVMYAGVCGSDLHIYEGAMMDRVRYPIILGHEFSGIVERVGSQVTWLSEGDEVVANPVISCGKCASCLAGRPNICMNFKILGVDVPGAFAEYLKIKAKNVYRIPKGLPLRDAALVEPFSVAVHSCRRAGIEVGDDIAIIGQGPIGLCVTQVAKHYGAHRVIAIEVLEDRLRFAKNIGADDAINPLKENPVDIVNSITNGIGVDKVIETSGSSTALNMALQLVKPGGRIVVVGLRFEQVQITPSIIVFKEAEIIGSRVYIDEFARTLKLMSKGYLNPSALITHEFRLEDTPKAFSMLEKKTENAIKILIKP